MLFFYGVLLQGLGDWPFLRGIGPARSATTQGTLFAIPDQSGWYPALVPGEGRVAGAVHDAGGVDLAAMDAFEGPDYERREIEVEVSGEVLASQAYCWIADLPDDAEPIPHGDFARWLTETGRRPISQH